ncbi:NAD-dependent DNA ligase [Vibrio phage USC-1]|uniref:DNA ligase (NAD(+)) n=2 Tax=Aphroditevirus USC1 TaxID=2846605 RepID=A0A514A2H0_9CAUD|nr:NAD-dependent DNA ligase [Vibrio phage USC-1]QCW23302.1 DNA ligase [Vibrio phage 5 TSL-2019]QDH47426.1 (NAD(+)) DNA ligase [Vibrio phage USC-1]
MSLFKARLESLVKQIRYHASVYYREDRSEISDADYDLLVQEYNQLISDHPELLTEENDLFKGKAVPIVEVNSEFEKVSHEPPMLSLDNVFTIEEYESWKDGLGAEDQNDIELEWKFDGIALRLTYENGKLKSLATRGTGLIGEDVTVNVDHFSNIPRELPEDFTEGKEIIIDGEGVIDLKLYEELNDLVPKPYVTPRHAAAGITRNRKLKELVTGSLTFIAHSFPRAIKSSYEDTMHALIALGFSTPKEYRVQQITTDRPSHLPFAVDGIVAKVRNYESRAKLGETNHHPRWATAFKFPTLVETPKLEDVVWETGRTGTITPVAQFLPVVIAGVTVQRATLYNFRTFQRESEGLRVGSVIKVGMSGDIIPKFFSVEKVGKGRQCKAPRDCPSCGEPLRFEGESKEQVFLTCTNHAKCPAQTLGRLYNYGSVDAMNIRGLGPASIARFNELGVLNTFVDLYHLRTMTQNQTLSKTEMNLLDAIDESRTTTFARFITGLGINGVGKGTAKELSKHIKDKDGLLTLLEDQAALMEIPDIGWGISMNIASYVKENRRTIEELLDLLEFEVMEIPDHSIQVTVTGKFPFRRKEIEACFTEQGYEVTDRVTSKTKLIVLGDYPTQHKVDTAKELGIPVLDIAVHPELTVNELLKEVQGY